MDQTEEAIQALRNLVLLVGSLTCCGYIELKPSPNSAGSLFQMPGFSVPQPVGKGTWGALDGCTLKEDGRGSGRVRCQCVQTLRHSWTYDSTHSHGHGQYTVVMDTDSTQ